MNTTKEKWIQGAHMSKGALHRALGVPQGKKIPAAKMQAAMHSKNMHVRKMAQMAKNMKG